VKKSDSGGRPSDPDLSQKDKKGLVKSGLAKSGPLELKLLQKLKTQKVKF
jgi:hypothetical protein